jgi:hypothetical protein
MNEEYQKRTYEDLSNELQKIYPAAARAFELIPLMYNRLTLVDMLNHKDAVEKIVADHQNLSGFSARNIRRYLPSDNLTIPKRIRPSWPKNSNTETNKPLQLSNTEQEKNSEAELDSRNNTKVYSSNDNSKSILDFEFSLPWDEVHRYMGLKFKVDGSSGKIWFNGRIDTQTSKVIAAYVGSLSDNY